MKRPGRLGQIVGGLGVGAIPAFALASNLAPEIAVGGGPALAMSVCAAVAIFMAGVTSLACLPPAGRALGIQPVETLKAN